MAEQMGEGATKVCPRCGAVLFSDMDVCYDCLFDFNARHAREALPADDGDENWEEHLGWVPSEQPAAPPASTCANSADTTAPLPKHIWKGGLALRVCSDGVEMTCPIPVAGLTIGRDSDNDVVLHDRSVSRSHVRVVAREGIAVVQDLGATNPAQLHGVALEGSCELKVGDELGICGTRLTVVRA